MPGTSVPLQLLKVLAVPVVVVPVTKANKGRVFGSITLAGQSVELSGFRHLFGGGSWFGWFGLFQLFLGRSLFTFLLQHSLLVLYVPLVLQLFLPLGIFVRHLERN